MSDSKMKAELAKGLVAMAFRNGPLEDIHADGRITQDEMKALMKHAVNVTYRWLVDLADSDSDWGERTLRAHDWYCQGWDDPEPLELEKA